MVNVKCLCFHLFPCFTEVWCSTQCMGTCSKLMPMETFWCVCMGSTSWRGKVHYSHFALNWAIIQTCVFKFSLGDKNCWNLTVLSSAAQRKCAGVSSEHETFRWCSPVCSLVKPVGGIVDVVVVLSRTWLWIRSIFLYFSNQWIFLCWRSKLKYRCCGHLPSTAEAGRSLITDSSMMVLLS